MKNNESAINTTDALRQANIIKTFYMTIAGYSIAEIAESLGSYKDNKPYSHGIIRKYLRLGLEWYANNAIEDIELLKQMRIAQLQSAFEELWSHARALINSSGKTSNIVSIFKEIRANIEAQSKIEGSQAPVKIDSNINVGIQLDGLSNKEKYDRFRELAEYYKQFKPSNNIKQLTESNDEGIAQ